VLDAATLSSALAALASLVGAAGGAYLAERVGEPAPEGEEPGKACVKYVAASAGAEAVLEARVGEGAGVLWPCWVMPPAPEAPEEEEEAPPAEEGEEGAPPPPPKKEPPPPPELPTLYVRNVLRDKRVVFHGIPRAGAFFAAPLQYGTPLHADAVPPPGDAAAGEEGGAPAEGGEGGEGAAAPAAPAAPAPGGAPKPVTVQRSLALCVDTCGSGGKELPPAAQAAVKRAAGWLKAAFERTEGAAFAAEYAALLAPRTPEAEAALAAEEKAEAEAAAKGASVGGPRACAYNYLSPSPARRLPSQRAAAHPPPPTHTHTPYRNNPTPFAAAGDEAAAAAGEEAAEDVKTLAKAGAVLAAARATLAAKRGELEALAARRVPPKEATLKVLQAALLLLGRKQEELGDAAAADPAAPAWGRLAAALAGGGAWDAVAGGFDPAAAGGKVLAYQKTEALRALLEGLPPGEELAAKEGRALAALAAWVRSACDVKDAAAAQRARLEEERKAKEAADKEAAAAKAAEEAEAAAAKAAEEAEAAAAAEGGEEGGEEAEE
jgi:hypothetical protein